MASSGDYDIVLQVLSGDADAFESLVESHKERVFKIVSSHVPSEAVEEVANDIFFKAFKSLNTFNNDSPFANWLSVIAVRACKDYWRLSYARKDAPMASFGEDFERAVNNRPAGKSPEEELLGSEALELLKKALERLKPNERIVINMLYTEERSVAEAAVLSGLSESNVKVTAFRARKKLAEIMNRMTGGNI